LLSKTDGQYSNILNDKKNIVQFLKSELDAKSDQLTELNNEMFSLVSFNEANKNEYNQEIETLKKNYEDKFESYIIDVDKLCKCRDCLKSCFFLNITL
jgi:hypothetical protein